MSIKALILDLDNTIYPVISIGERLFKSLFELIKDSGEYQGDFDEIKAKIMKQPFQKIADEHSFSRELKDECVHLLSNLTYNHPFEPFGDYNYVQHLPYAKFLVTTGFKKLQQSKVDQLKLEKDFTEIFIIDPQETEMQKKDIFKQIMDKYGYAREEVAAIGDDVESEIKAADELGMISIVYNHDGKNDTTAKKSIGSFEELQKNLK